MKITVHFQMYLCAKKSNGKIVHIVQFESLEEYPFVRFINSPTVDFPFIVLVLLPSQRMWRTLGMVSNLMTRIRTHARTHTHSWQY